MPTPATPEKAAAPRRGRPQNQQLNDLEAELSVSRRQAASLLSDPPKSEIGIARLEKLRQEIVRIKLQIADLRRQARVARGELLTISEARELMGRPHQSAAHLLKNMAKQLAPRLASQPLREIERSLNEFADGVLEQIRTTI